MAKQQAIGKVAHSMSGQFRSMQLVRPPSHCKTVGWCCAASSLSMILAEPAASTPGAGHRAGIVPDG
jgi:hypothetical protein